MPPKTVVPDASKGLTDNTNLSEEDAANVQRQLDGAIDSAFSGGQAQEKANQARERAAEASNDDDRKRFEEEAAKHEKEAQSQLKTSRRLQSGAWQGFGAGAATGAATGIGLGGVIGTLSGGVLAVPLSGLGGLIGAGAGYFHGPWIKLTRGENGPEITKAKEGEPGAIKLSSEEVEAIKQNVEQKGSDAMQGATSSITSLVRNKPKPGRRPPKKLQIRGGNK